MCVGILSCGEGGGWCAEDEYEVRGLLVAKETVLGAPNKGRQTRMIQVLINYISD